jgi:hypothetical protein
MDNTITVRLRADGKVLLTQGDPYDIENYNVISLSAVQVLAVTQTFADLIDTAMRDDAEPGKPGIPQDMSGMN